MRITPNPRGRGSPADRGCRPGQGGDGLLGRLLDQRLGTEGDAEPGEAEHRQVVGSITHGDGLLQAQSFLLRQLAQQIGLALGIDDRLDRHAGDLAVFDLQLVGEYVVDAQLGLQLLGEIAEAAGEDRRLVAQALELGEQHLGTLGQAQAGADIGQHVFRQPLEQRQALLEAGAEIQFAAHRALGDLRHLLANASGLGQLVDDLGLDQRRVHIEHGQATVAPVDRIALEGDIDVQLLRHAEELGTQCGRVGRLAAHGELDAALARSSGMSSGIRPDSRSMWSMLSPYLAVIELTRCSCSAVTLRVSSVTMCRALPCPATQCW